MSEPVVTEAKEKESGYAIGGAAPRGMEPKRGSMRTMDRVPHNEMLSLRRKMDRLARGPKGTWVGPVGWLFLGSAVAGLVAAIPMAAARNSGNTPAFAQWVWYVYWVAVGACLLIALICGLLSRTVKAQRGETIEWLRDDLDELLRRYPAPIPKTDTPPSKLELLRSLLGWKT